ncbi:MAG: 3-hydroxyacyl-ACP dehydratase [Bacteroidota bacterium]
MLADNFFETILFNLEKTEGPEQQLHAVVILKSDHQIFSGHFPGNPVVPGVTQVQMVKEMVEKALNHPLRLYESDNIKFLSMIDPRSVSRLELAIGIRDIADNNYAVSAVISSGDKVFFKFKGKFELEN